MSQLKTRIVPSPKALRRNRLLLIGGIVTVLPAAAFVPSLITHSQSQTPLLVAVDEMAMETSANARANEHAVALTARRNGMTFDGAEPHAMNADSFTFASLVNVDAKSEALAGVSSAIEIKPDASRDSEVRWFNGRALRPVRTLSMTVTAYSPDAESCGDSADGITASGYSVWTNGMKMVAADTSLFPFGTLVSIPGYDDANPVPVLDRGGAIKGQRLDVLYPTHDQAMDWGVQRLQVTVWEYADGMPADFETQHALVSR